MRQTLLQKTESHYNEFPFIEGGENRIRWWREYLSNFLPDKDIQHRLILDVGSSVGEISRGLIDRGARLTCLDLSLESLKRCQQINAEARIFHANALRLPFADDSFDHAISIGVLHHTPDCRQGFKEIARVTAPGGSIVLFLYNYWSIYNVIYHIAKPVRSTVQLDRVPHWLLKFLQPFVKSHLGQTLNEQQLRNLLGDKLWTPQATFHSVSEVRRWGMQEGLALLAAKKFFFGYANVMRFVKQGRQEANVDREIKLKCVKCDAVPMQKSAGGYRCPRCSYEFNDIGGIIRCLGPQ